MSDFKQNTNKLRGDIKNLAEEVDEIMSTADENELYDLGEVMANLKLSYRALEDASMRLGKAIQYSDGGVSVYDKETTAGVTEGATEEQ